MSDDRHSLSRRTILWTTGLTLASALTGVTTGTATRQNNDGGSTDDENSESSDGTDGNRDEVMEIISDWKKKQRKTAEQTMDKYGVPEGVTERRLIWHNSGPWKRTELFRDAIPHNFPKKHVDFLEQFIDYPIPNEKADELLEYDGSVMFERTKGEMSARCDQEPANFLTINLANDIITDQKSVEEARQAYAETIKQLLNGESPPYTQGFQFELPEGNQRDPGEAIIGENGC